MMRLLDQKKINYEPIYYDLGVIEFSGAAVAQLTGMKEEESFKTLVLKGDKGVPVVCVLPVNQEVNLKKAAVLAGVKKLDMVSVKELQALTGYERGAVSPLGMKKNYRTFIDASAENLKWIVISAGKKGTSVKLNPLDLKGITAYEFADIT